MNPLESAFVRTIGPILLAILTAACSAPPAALVVKPFTLRDEKRDPGSEPMVEMEKQRRLLGAVSMKERRQRLGQYYTVVWNDPHAGAPVTVAFSYLQGGTASRVKTTERSFPAAATSGTAEFAVRGDNYFDHGRVTAWRISLKRGGMEVAAKQSYLWE
ncbi:MAG: hypothetical protein V4733_06700 [Verrucomicrobiota bacterium]